MDTPGPRWLCPGRCWRRSWGRSVVCERRRARDEQLPRLNGSGVEPRRAEMVCRKVRVTYRRLGSLGPTRCSTGQPGREKGTSLHSASLTTKPPASSNHFLGRQSVASKHCCSVEQAELIRLLRGTAPLPVRTHLDRAPRDHRGGIRLKPELARSEVLRIPFDGRSTSALPARTPVPSYCSRRTGPSQGPRDRSETGRRTKATGTETEPGGALSLQPCIAPGNVRWRRCYRR